MHNHRRTTRRKIFNEEEIDGEDDSDSQDLDDFLEGADETGTATIFENKERKTRGPR